MRLLIQGHQINLFVYANFCYFWPKSDLLHQTTLQSLRTKCLWFFRAAENKYSKRSGHGGPRNYIALKLCYLWFALYVWPFCLSDWIFKSLLPVTIGLIRALGRFGFPDNYLITRLFPQEAPPPSPASQLVTTKQSFSNFRYLFILSWIFLSYLFFCHKLFLQSFFVLSNFCLLTRILSVS